MITSGPIAKLFFVCFKELIIIFPDGPRGLLFKKAQATLGLGLCMSDMVQVPDGEDEKEWIAVHAVDFFNRISLIYGTLSDKCTLHSCPSMNHTNGTKVIILTIG